LTGARHLPEGRGKTQNKGRKRKESREVRGGERS